MPFMKTAIYARVSTRKQDEANQVIQLREFAEKQGWEVVTEYCDVVSGSGKQERPSVNLTFSCSGRWIGSAVRA
jgi:DNA invertase Pin-like site-specific DNA recombinase